MIVVIWKESPSPETPMSVFLDLSYKNSSGDVQQLMKPAEVKSSAPQRVIGHLVEVSTFGEPPAKN